MVAAADVLPVWMCLAESPHLYQVVRPAVVRAGVEPNSLRTERLRIGERLTILESREFGGARGIVILNEIDIVASLRFHHGCCAQV